MALRENRYITPDVKGVVTINESALNTRGRGHSVEFIGQDETALFLYHTQERQGSKGSQRIHVHPMSAGQAV